ncbi:MAG: hypothetical protein ACP5N2_00875 [Candidatus Nanoarchaeia archaeon]
MTLIRKINELMQGRVLFKTEENASNKHLLKNPSFKEMCEKSNITMTINTGDDSFLNTYAVCYRFSGGYKFNGVDHKNPELDINEPWLGYIRQDYSANFVNAPSWAILESIDRMARGIIPKDTLVKFSHEVYANAKSEKHYLDISFDGDLNYTKNYTTKFWGSQTGIEIEKNVTKKVHLKGFMNWEVKSRR